MLRKKKILVWALKMPKMAKNPKKFCIPCYFDVYRALIFQYDGSKLLGKVLDNMQLALEVVEYGSKVLYRKKLWLNFKKT